MSEFIDTDGASNPNENIIDDLTGLGTVELNGQAEPDSIDAMFGFGSEPKTDTNKPAGEPTISSPSKVKQTPEEYVRELQSKADKALNQLKQLEAKNQELSGAASFVEQLYSDQEVFKAFVAEINPELVKPSTPEDYIKNGLKKEFGDDFIPNESEEHIRGSRTWLYNKRADALYEEAITKTNKIPENIKQLKEKRAQAQKILQDNAEKEKREILADFKWTDNDYSGFLNWANKVSIKDFAKLYQYGKQKKSQNSSRTPNLASVPGGTRLSDSAYNNELNNFFG